MTLIRITTVLLAIASFSTAGDLKLSPELVNLNADAMVNVIAQFRVPPTEAHHQRIVQGGGMLKRALDLINGALYSVPAGELERISSDPDITYITADRSVRAMEDHKTSAVYADIARQNGYDGTGVTIAFLDSGIEDRPGVVYSESFVAGEDSADRNGHGTRVATLGVAPNSQVVNLKVLDSRGVGTDSAAIAALDQAVKLQKTYRIRIINLSLGRPVYESYLKDPLCQAVENAWARGILVVVAAGNEGRSNSAGMNGYATITSPANDPYVLTVGAMNTHRTPSRGDDTMASYSSKGPTLVDHIVKPDLVAPGSPFQGGGTSIAAAIASGAAALLLQKDPTLTPDHMKARLMKSASKNFPKSSTVYDAETGASYTTQYDIFTVGAGYLDVWSALNNWDLVEGSALSPTAVRDQHSGKVTVVNTHGAVWGGAPGWTAPAVWGGSAWVDGAAAEWGRGEVWGAGAVWGGAPTGTSGVASGYGAVWGGGPNSGKN